MTDIQKPRPADRQDPSKSTASSQNSARTEFPAISTFKKIASAVLLVFILVLARQHIMSFLQWPPLVYSDPGVFNLTRAAVEWDVYYGEPQLCGKVECHLLPSYVSANFTKKAVLPSREFPLKGYKKGQVIYYRTTVRLPSHLLDEDNVIAFHSVYIWAEKYRFYVNGNFVDAGSKTMLNIPIPGHLVPEDGIITLTFRIDPGALHYQGLAHMGDLIIGPKSAFTKLEHLTHDLKHGFYLWHMLPRLTTCLVFIFFFFAVTRGSEMFMFVLYAFSGAMHIYFLSDLPAAIFEQTHFKDAVSPVMSVLSSVLFFALVHRFFRCTYDTRAKWFAALGCAIVVGTIGLVLAAELGAVHAIINRANYGLRIMGSVYAVYLSLKTFRMLKKSGKSPHRQKASLVFFFFNACVLTTYSLAVLNVIPGILKPTTIFVSDTLLLVVFAALVSQEFGTTLIQRDQISRTFRRFMGASVADSVVSAGKDLKPIEQNVSVMFSDIRSFTSMCERSKPAEIFTFLNEYFEMMVSVITEHGGVVDKFGGDSIMAVWGAPDKNEMHALDAARCALAMRSALAAYNGRRIADGKEEIKIGIGIHSGPVMAGAIGSDERQEYTVIGDTVNTASRVEGLTKSHGTDVLVSGSTWSQISEFAVGQSMGSSAVKGRSEAIDLYSLRQILVEDLQKAS